MYKIMLALHYVLTSDGWKSFPVFYLISFLFCAVLKFQTVDETPSLESSSSNLSQFPKDEIKQSEMEPETLKCEMAAMSMPATSHFI